MKKKVLLSLILLSCGVSGVHAANDLAQLNVYPNPVKRASGNNILTFDNITQQMRIRIYTVTGTLVRDIDLVGAGNAYQWDLRNNSNQEVASGIYVYLLTNSAGEKKSGKIAIIR